MSKRVEAPVTPRKQLMGPPPVPATSTAHAVVSRSRSLSVTPTKRPISPSPARQLPLTEPIKRVKREVSVASSVKTEYGSTPSPSPSPSPSPARRLFGDGELWPAAALRSRRESSTASTLFSTSTRQDSLATDLPRSIRGVSRLSFDFGGRSRPRRRPSGGLIADGGKASGLATAVPPPAMPSAIDDELDRASRLFGNWASKVAVDVDADDSDDDDATGPQTESDKKREAVDLLFAQLFWDRSSTNIAAVQQELGPSASIKPHRISQVVAAVESCLRPLLEAALDGYPSKGAGRTAPKVDARKADIFGKVKGQCSSITLPLDNNTADRAWRTLGRRWESEAELALTQVALGSFVKGLQQEEILDAIDIVRCLGKQILKMLGTA